MKLLASDVPDNSKRINVNAQKIGDNVKISSLNSHHFVKNICSEAIRIMITQFPTVSVDDFLRKAKAL